jgi:hypothetical protein
MPDRDTVWDHFASAIAAYRLAAGADGQVARDTWTSYQLLATPDGWRFLSYTNHF